MKQIFFILLLLILFSCDDSSSSGSGIPSDGLYLHYKLDGNADDSSDNLRHGTISGSVTATSDRNGKSGQAMDFNGTNAFISFNMTDAEFDSNYVTITAWINVDDFSNSKTFPVFTKENNTPEGEDLDTEFQFIIDGSGFKFVPYDGRINKTFVKNQWYFIAIRVQKFNVVLSVDNSLIGNVSKASLFNMQNKQFNIGAAISGEKSYFDGKMDNIRIYNRILTDKEIKNISKEN